MQPKNFMACNIFFDFLVRFTRYKCIAYMEESACTKILDIFRAKTLVQTQVKTNNKF